MKKQTDFGQENEKSALQILSYNKLKNYFYAFEHSESSLKDRQTDGQTDE